jgi:rhodanese-related sulfurtransferase
MTSGTVDFLLVDVRGRQAYSKSHVSGAINIPLLTITEDRMKEYPPETVFVVYCAGPHCNGANKAAIRLSKLGRPVKEMIGGATGWWPDYYSIVVFESRRCPWDPSYSLRRSVSHPTVTAVIIADGLRLIGRR